MKLTTTVASFCSLVLVASAQAPETNNNPSMVTYQAILQEGKPVQGTITGVSGSNGTGVEFNVSFHQFPDPNIGSYKYHIHVSPVPEDGNCTATGGHLDPYNVGDPYMCPGETGAVTCQVGDLSGKHGAVDTSTLGAASYMTQYLDYYLSTVPDTVGFFGNRSFVIHDQSGARLNCGNFVLQTVPSSNGTGTMPGNYTSPAPTKTDSAQATGVDTGTATWGTPSSSISPGMNLGVSNIHTSPVLNLIRLGLVAVGMAFL